MVKFGPVEDMEFRVAELGMYPAYCTMVSDLSSRGREPYCDQIRYMLGLANFFQMNGVAGDVLFVGGLGVLGSVANRLGTKTIPQFRDTHDLDVVVKNASLISLVESFFDELHDSHDSYAISGKRTVKGVSSDAEGRGLRPTSVDVCYPHNGRSEIAMPEVILSESQFDRSLVTNFYGVPVTTLSPEGLLELKLSVFTASDGLPRERDRKDILNLVGVIEQCGYNPRKVRDYLGRRKIEVLKKVSQPKLNLNRDGILLPVSNDYMGELTR